MNPPPLLPETSLIRAEHIQGESRVTESRSVAPLRFLQTRLSPLAAGVVISSYGGGLVQGDQIRMEFHCGQDARLLVATQGNSRVFRHRAGQPARQTLHGHVEECGKMIVLPDPLVLHAESRLQLHQSWNLHPSASLLLADWLQSGRSDSGEVYAFQEYDSLIEIRINGDLCLREPFSVIPADFPPRSPGTFGDCDHLLTLYGVGEMADLLLDTLEPCVLPREERTQVPTLNDRPYSPATSSLRSLVRLPDRPISLFRALGKTRMDFDDIWEALESALASDSWLGQGTNLPCHRRPRRP